MNTMDGLAPTLLIAMPALEDPNFARGVVLLLHHDDEGALGLLINRAADVELPAFCAEHELPHGPGTQGCPLRIGGPCELRRGFLLHQSPELAEHRVEVAPNVFLSNDTPSVRAILERGAPPLSFVLGYSGWGAGQLEGEIAAGAWLTAPVHAARVFDDEPQGVWLRALADLGIDPAHLCVSGERH